MDCERLFCTALLAAVVTSAAARADSVSVGFESSEGYAVGNINGQPTSGAQWSKTGGYDAVVSNGDAHSGTQSLRISNGFASGSFGDQTFSPHLSQAAGEPDTTGAVDAFFEATWYFKPVTTDIQNGLSIVASADNGQGARMTWLQMAESTTDGLYLGFYDYDSVTPGVEDWRYTVLAKNLDPREWHSVVMDVSFVNGNGNNGIGNDVVTIFLDGKNVGGGTTWEDFYRYGPILDGGGRGIAPVNSLLFRAGGDSVPGTLGKGFYIDDISYSDSNIPTPEPGTVGLLLMGLGGIATAALRRNRDNRG